RPAGSSSSTRRPAIWTVWTSPSPASVWSGARRRRRY
ncbi:MAG: hypothetical protein AVDCRST_MAG19-3159, partial [uncultured Thermomicrobiales bacterium]